jgi:hypothetical protein
MHILPLGEEEEEREEGEDSGEESSEEQQAQNGREAADPGQASTDETREYPRQSFAITDDDYRMHVDDERTCRRDLHPRFSIKPIRVIVRFANALLRGKSRWGTQNRHP